MAIQAQFPSYGTMDWVDISCGGGGGGSFNDNYYSNLQQQQLIFQQQQEQQKQQHCNIQQGNQSVFLEKRSLFCPMASPSQSLVVSFEEKQRQEIGHYLRMQSERLRVILQEQRKQHLAMLLKRIESKVLPLMGQKDGEIAQASEKNRELEYLLKKLEVEKQEWQRLAQENEAMIISLNNTIQQLQEKTSSCCSNNNAVEKREGGLSEEEGNRGKVMIVCKVCECREACVLFLPCRHLSSCEVCQGFLEACPSCLTVKKATIQALIG